MVDQLGQKHDQHQHQNGSDNDHQLRGGADDVDGFVQDSDGGIRHGLTAGDIGRGVLQQIADADGRDHDGHSRRVAQGLIGRPLNEEAQRHRQDDDNRNRRVDRHHGGNIDAQQARDHEHVAVGEVDQAQNAVDHGIANGDQRQLPTKRNAAEQNGYQVFQRKQLFHKGFLPFFTESPKKPSAAPLRTAFSEIPCLKKYDCLAGVCVPRQTIQIGDKISCRSRSERSPESRCRWRCPPS